MVVPDGIRRGDGVLHPVDGLRATGLVVRFVERRSGAGDGHAHLVALVEDDARPADVPRQLRGFARGEQHLFLESLAISRPHRVIHEQHAAAVGVHITHAQDEVGVLRRGTGVDLRLHLAGPFGRLAERRGGPRAHLALLLKGARVPGAGKRRTGDAHRRMRIARIAGFRRRGGHAAARERALGLEIEGCALGSGRKVRCLAPNIARRTFLPRGAHHVIPHHRLLLDAIGLAFEVVVEPLRHVRIDIEHGVLREDEFADLVRLRITAVQPWAEEEMLLSARIWPAVLLPADEAGDRALAHEVIPAPDREAGQVHLVEVQGSILVAPVVVVIGMLVPLAQQRVVVGDVARDFAAGLESLGAGHTADAIALLVKAQAGIGHVLRDQVRRLGHRQIVLGITRLGAAIRPDLARAPRLRGQPLTDVIAIAQRSPLQPAIAAINSFAFVRAAIVHEPDDESTLGEFRRRLARACAGDFRIALLEDRGPFPLAFREVEIDGELFAIAHRHHQVLLAHAAEVERRQISAVRGGGELRGREDKQEGEAVHGAGLRKCSKKW